MNMNMCSICRSTPVAVSNIYSYHPSSPGRKSRSSAESLLLATVAQLAEIGSITMQDDEYANAIERHLTAARNGDEFRQELVLKQQRIADLQKQKERLLELIGKRGAARRELREHQERQLAQQQAAKQMKQEIALKTGILQELQAVLLKKAQQLELSRLRKAVQVFRMIAIVPSELPSNRSKVTGCSTIMGIPLPNNAVFDSSPIDCVLMGIMHIAHAVDALSAALNIPLPHRLYPFDLNGPLLSPQFAESTIYPLWPVSFHGLRDQVRDFNWSTLRTLQAEAAADSDYVINPLFQQTMILLQADILALCMRAGLTAQALYPPAAMLFNLHVLLLHCTRSAKALEALCGGGECTQEEVSDERVSQRIYEGLCHRYAHKQAARSARPPASSMGLDEEDWQVVEKDGEDADVEGEAADG